MPHLFDTLLLRPNPELSPHSNIQYVYFIHTPHIPLKQYIKLQYDKYETIRK